jgi:predicted O-methyltransferase YrrM
MRRSHKLQAYLDERASPIPDYLKQIERTTFLRTLSPQMLTGHMQGRFLSWLVEWLSPKQILEIGTFTGYSAVCFAERLQEGGHVTTIEVNDQLEGIIKEHFALCGFAERLQLIIGNANEVLPKLTGPYDLVYLDAKKDDYPQQFELVSERLAPGGYVLFDNVLWDGQVVDPDQNRATTVLLREFTLALAQNPRWETLMLPMSDGLLLVRETQER